MAQQTESSIVIDASAAKVMEVIADLGTHPEWAGVKATRVLATFPDGRPKEVEMTIDTGPIKDTYSIRVPVARGSTGQLAVDRIDGPARSRRDLPGQ